MVQKSGRKRHKNLVSPEKRCLYLGVNKKSPPFSSDNVALQSWLRPALTPVGPNADHRQLVAELERIDAALRESSVEQQAGVMAVENLVMAFGGKDPGWKAEKKAIEFAIFSLRAEVLRHLRGLPSFRKYSQMLSTSDLLADFCGILRIDGIRCSSKSTLERASKCFSAHQWQRLGRTLTEAAGKADSCGSLGLGEAVDTAVVLGDSTCLEANIHFPVDWVLLKDVGLTLLNSIKLVRREKLLNRMEDGPEALARQMNRLCIEITHSARRKDGHKKRKALLRELKAHLRRIGKHARKHCDLLKDRWEQTRWSRKQAQRIIDHMEARMALIPKVIRQAHERIIGGRKLPSKEKILSAHERDLHTLVRRKAGKEVEFGNALFIAESPDGFILDHCFYRQSPPGEPQKMAESLKRQQTLDVDQAVTDFVGDRGFDSRRANDDLEEQGIANQICPRNPEALRERMGDQRFRGLQKRRGGTEARIAILKNKGDGRVCRAKGFAARERAVACGVLSHNLLWIARRGLQYLSESTEAA